MAPLLFNLGGAFFGARKCAPLDPARAGEGQIKPASRSRRGAFKAIRKQLGKRTFWQCYCITRQNKLMMVAGKDIATLGGLTFALLLVILTADPLLLAKIAHVIAVPAKVAPVYNLLILQWGSIIAVTVKPRMHQRGNATRLIGVLNACKAALRQRFSPCSRYFFEPDHTE